MRKYIFFGFVALLLAPLSVSYANVTPEQMAQKVSNLQQLQVRVRSEEALPNEDKSDCLRGISQQIEYFQAQTAPYNEPEIRQQEMKGSIENDDCIRKIEQARMREITEKMNRY